MARVVNGVTASGHVLPRRAEKSVFKALFIHNAWLMANISCVY